MDKREAIQIAKKFIYSIPPEYRLENAIMFGSFAKGTQNASSDIDIALVLNNELNIIQTQIELLILRRKINLLIEPHLFRVEDFNNSHPLVSEILTHGFKIDLNEVQ